MKFKGTRGAFVRHRGKVIASFPNGVFDTGDPGVIRRLKMLGYSEVDAEEKPNPLAPETPVVPEVLAEEAPSPKDEVEGVEDEEEGEEEEEEVPEVKEVKKVVKKKKGKK